MAAPEKKEQVIEWFKQHPTASAAECSRQIGVTEKTARKWKKIMLTEQEDPGQITIYDCIENIKKEG